MNFANNLARIFFITVLIFGEAQIIGGIVPNMIAFSLFLGAIGVLLQPEKCLRYSTGKLKNRAKFFYSHQRFNNWEVEQIFAQKTRNMF